MDKKQKNFFILSLILIAIAGLIFFKPVRNTVQYPEFGVWAEKWAETETTTKSTIHIVGTTAGNRETVCFQNLKGDLYKGAYLSGERFDNSDCPSYTPVVSRFFVENNQPCISIQDKKIVDAECFTKYTDEQVASGHPYDTQRYQCIANSGSLFGCAIHDVQTTIVLTKKEQAPIETPNQPSTPAEPETPTQANTTKSPQILIILGLFSGLTIMGTIIYFKTKKR